MIWIATIITAVVWAWVIFTDNRPRGSAPVSPIAVLVAKVMIAAVFTLLAWLVFFIWH